MHHLESMFLPDEFIQKLPKPIKDKVLEVEAIDFAFEQYPEVFGKALKPGLPAKFFVPLSNGEEQFFDFSMDNEPEDIARKPSKEELKERGKSIPVLPKDWYNAYLNRLGEPLLHLEKKKHKEQRDLTKVKTLAVFDFDETLFRSDKAAERQPTDHPLSPDSIPDNPKLSDWNSWVVRRAQELCANPHVYCVMMTGKVGDVFREKVDGMLKDRRLFFAETHYNEFGGDTAKYKIETIYNIIDKLPNVRNLIMWDDQEEKAKKYTEEFSDKINFKIIMVEEDDKN